MYRSYLWLFFLVFRFCHGIDSSRSLFFPTQKEDSRRWHPKVIATSAESKVDLGTTLIAIRYQQGVVVAADTRTSVSGYVSNRFAQKIHAVSGPLSSSSWTSSSSLPFQPGVGCVILRSGSSADTQQLVADCTQFVQSRWYRYGGGGGGQEDVSSSYLSVSQIAHWLRYQIQRSRRQHGNDDDDDDDDDDPDKRNSRELSTSLLVAGYDPVTETGQIFSIASSGALWPAQDAFAVSGSGSPYILGYLQHEINRLATTTASALSDGNGDDKHDTKDTKDATRFLPTLDQAITLAQRAIEAGIQWDAASGGVVRMVIVSRHGMEERVILRPNRSSP